MRRALEIFSLIMRNVYRKVRTNFDLELESEDSGTRYSVFRSKPFWIGVATVGIVSVAVYGFLFCYPTTIIATGTTLTVPANSHVQYGFTRSSNGPGGVYGEFSSDHGATMYVMSVPQLSQFNSTGSPASYIYSSGQVTFVIVGGKSPFVYLKQPGQYYIVFYNPGASTTSVTITTTFSIEIC